MDNQLFIGYGDLDAMLNGHHFNDPLYANCLEEPGKPDARFGVAINVFAIEIQSIRPEGVHYVHMRVGTIQTINGGQYWHDDDHRQAWDRAKSAWEIVQAYLKDRGFILRQATVATPKDLRYLDGWADCLGWDKEAKRFYDKRKVERIADMLMAIPANVEPEIPSEAQP